jgi:glycosyltransferase involved in cell wall biosynthesis
LKVSIITVSFNSAKTIADTIDSVLSQDYPEIEYIIVDGDSTDGTVDIIRKNEDRISRWISEKDQGMYDAMNKGITMAY